MKKCLVILFILLLSCVSAFSLDIPPETVKITANVPDGAGVNGNDSINLGGGVFLTIAIPRDGDIPSNTAPERWESNYESIGENETVRAKLVDTDTNKNACEKFYLAYGLKGNPSKKVNVGISVSVDGWYFGTTETVDTKASENMTLISDTTSQTPSEATFITSTVGTKDELNVAFDNGLAASEVLVGYSEISWGVKEGYTPPAGDYSATVTITITSEGESQTGEVSA